MSQSMYAKRIGALNRALTLYSNCVKQGHYTISESAYQSIFDTIQKLPISEHQDWQYKFRLLELIH